jgi:hypothetical protein
MDRRNGNVQENSCTVLNIESRSSGFWHHLQGEDGGSRTPEMLVSYHNTAQCQNPEDIDLKHHCHESQQTYRS